MNRRKRIGLIYNYSEDWIGGTYYRYNFVRALSQLEDRSKPELYVFTDFPENFTDLKRETGYPYLYHWKFVPGLFLRAVNKAARIFIKRNLFDPRPTNKDIDFLFPNPRGSFFDLLADEKKIYWIPDFQEAYFPDFFPVDDIKKRKKEQLEVSQSPLKIIFSSKDALKDFDKLYPLNVSKKTVIPFAVTNSQSFQKIDAQQLLQKYGLAQPFFISPNQFWIHKNHQVVVEAVDQLVKSGKDIVVVFTGKEHDQRSPGYAEQIKDLVKLKSLESKIKFLGFIPRDELLKLMQISVAVIQPSLFEGWSTVIEDAKSLNKFILASDLAVHQEQLGFYQGKDYFKREEPEDLKACLERFMDKSNAEFVFDYDKEILKYAKKILALTEDF